MTATIDLNPGVRFTDTSGTFTIIQWEYRDDGELYAMIERGGEREWVPYADTVDLCQQRVPLRTESSPFDFTREARFAYLGDAERTKLLWLASHVLEVMHGDPGGMVHAPRPTHVPRPQYDPAITTLHQRVQAKVEELKDSKNGTPISKTGLYRMRTAMLNSGIEGLIHKSKLTAIDSVARLGDEYGDIARDLANELAKETKSFVSKKNRMAMYRARLMAKNVDYSKVSKSALAKVMDVAAANTGIDKPASVRLSQASRPRDLYGRYVVTRPDEILQIDSTSLDVKAWSPICGWCSVDAIIGIDAFDRRVRVFKLVPAPHTARDVAIALAQLFMPATGVGPKAPHWSSGGPDTIEIPPDLKPTNMGGTPLTGRGVDTIVMDHGAQFDSRLVSSLLTAVGVTTIFAAPRRGHQKAMIESFNRQVAQWAQQFPGAKGNRTANRGNNPEGDALLTIEELEAALRYRVEHIYHRAPHEGLRDPADPKRRISPNEAYALYVATGGAPTVLARPAAAFDFLPSIMCRANERGIELNGVRYDGPGLTGLRDRDGRMHKPDLRVAYDPNDPTRIYVEAGPNDWRCVRDYGTQIGSGTPLKISRVDAANSNLKKHSLTNDETEFEMAKTVKEEAKEYTEMEKRKLARTFERMLAAERDRTTLGIALLAPDPVIDWNDRDKPQFLDPDPDTEDELGATFDSWREDIAEAEGVFSL